MAWTGSKFKAVAADIFERAGWSAGQVFFATMVAGNVAMTNLPWKYASVLALGAALSSVVLTILQYLSRQTNLSFWPDVAVRLVKTFLGSLAAAWAASSVFDITTFHWSAAFNLAALATLSALGKALLARGSVAVTSATAGQANPSTLPVSTYVDATRAPAK